jgi:hypothetical protein
MSIDLLKGFLSEPESVEPVPPQKAPSDPPIGDPPLSGINALRLMMEAGAENMFSAPVSERFKLPDEFGASQYDRQIELTDQLDNINDMRGQLQPLYDKVGNSIAKFGGLTGARTAGAFMTLGGAAFKLKEDPSISALWNNEGARIADEWAEGIEEAFPHYYMDADREKSLGAQMLTYNFWGDEVVNGLSFLSAAALTGYLTGGIGTLAGTLATSATRLNSFNRLIHATKGFRGLTTAGMAAEKGITAAGTAGSMAKVGGGLLNIATGAMYESGLEARMSYDENKEGLVEQLYGDRIRNVEKERGQALTALEKYELLSPEELGEIDKQVTDVANLQFAGNLLLVGTGNMLMLGKHFGLGRVTKPFVNTVRRAGLDFSGIENGIIKQLQKKISDPNIVRGIGAAKWAGRAAYEGFVEEGGQAALARMGENYINNAVHVSPEGVSTLRNYMDSWEEYFGMATDREEYFGSDAMKEMVIGTLIGGMGMPKMVGGPGLLASGPLQETRNRIEAIKQKKDLNARILSIIEKDREKNPERYVNQDHKAVLFRNTVNRIKAYEAAVKSKNEDLIRKLKADEDFDLLFMFNETGQLNEQSKLYEATIDELLKKDPEEFKQVYGLDPQLAKEDLAKVAEDLKKSKRETVKEFKEAVDKVDAAFPMDFNQRYTGIDNTESDSFRRRIMIRSLAGAKTADALEKNLIEELANLTGGKVTSNGDDRVDSIVYTDKDGTVRTANIGKLNIGKSINEQIMELSARISELEPATWAMGNLMFTGKPAQRRQQALEELEQLRNFKETLEKYENKSRGLYNVLMESRESSEDSSVEQWIQEDPIAAASDMERVKSILDTLREVRQERIAFGKMYMDATDPVTYKEMVKDAQKEVNSAYQKLKDEQEQKIAERQSLVEELKQKIEAFKQLGYQDIHQEIQELNVQIEEAQVELDAHLENISGLQSEMQEVSTEIESIEADTVREYPDTLEATIAKDMALKAMDLIQSGKPLNDNDIALIQNASNELYKEYKRLSGLKESSEKIQIPARQMERSLLEMARDMEIFEEYLNWTQDPIGRFDKTLGRIQNEFNSKIEQLWKGDRPGRESEFNKRMNDLDRRKQELLKELSTRQVSALELQGVIDNAKVKKQELQDSLDNVSGKYKVAKKELLDLNSALDLLSGQELTENDLEAFRNSFIETVTAVYGEDSPFDLETAAPGTEASRDLLMAHQRAMKMLRDSVDGSIEALDNEYSQAQERLAVFEGQIAAAEELLKDLEEMVKSDPAMAEELMTLYGTDAKTLLETNRAAKDSLLARMEEITQRKQEINERDAKMGTLQNIYNHFRMVQVFQDVLRYDREVGFNVESEMLPETVEAYSDMDSAVEEEQAEYKVKPNISIKFNKSVNWGHSSILDEIKRLEAEKRNAEQRGITFDPKDQTALDRLYDERRWFNWIHNSGKGKNGVLNPFTRLLVINENNVPDYLKDAFPKERFFRNEDGTTQQVFLVAVNYRKDPLTITPISYKEQTEGITTSATTGLVFTSLMDPKEDNVAQKMRDTFSGTEGMTDEGLVRVNDNYKALKEKALKATEPVLLPISGMSQGVVNPKLDHVLSAPKDVMSNVIATPLSVVIPKEKGSKDPISFIEDPDGIKLVEARSKVGYVYGYDVRSGRRIPMLRSLLNEADSSHMMDMFQLMLTRYRDADRASKSDVTVKSEVENSRVSPEHPVTMFQYIKDHVQLKFGKNEYQLHFALSNKDMVIIYGPESKKVTLADLEAKGEAYNALKEFMGTKRYHGNYHTIKNAVESRKNKGYHTGEFTSKTPWVKFSVKPDMSVTVAKKYENYNQFLLEDVNGHSPLKAMLNPMKGETLDTPFFVGGYVTFNPSPISKIPSTAKAVKAASVKQESQVKKADFKVKTDSGIITIYSDGSMTYENGNPVTEDRVKNKALVRRSLQEGTLRTAEYNKTTYKILPDDRIISMAGTSIGKEVYIKPSTARTSILEQAVLEPAPEVKTDQPVESNIVTYSGSESSTVENLQNLFDPTEAFTGTETKIDPFDRTPTEADLERAPVVGDGAITGEEITVSESQQQRASEMLKKSQGVPQTDQRFSEKVDVLPTIESNDLKITLVEGKNSETFTIKDFERVTADNLQSSLEGIKLSPEVLNAVLTVVQDNQSNAPFMRMTQVGNVVTDATLAEVTDEIARAQKMTPLEVTITNVLLGRLDDPAVAQLTEFGRVMLSTMAPSGAVYHEAFHNVSLYILSRRDQDVLYSKVRSLEGMVKDFRGNEVAFKDMNKQQIEEWLAEEFRKWILSGMTRKVGKEDVTDDRNMIRRFFDAVRLLMRRLFRLNDSFEYDPSISSIEGLFRSIESGKFIKSLPDPMRSSKNDIFMRTRPDGVSADTSSRMQKALIAQISKVIGSTYESEGVDVKITVDDLFEHFTSNRLDTGSEHGQKVREAVSASFVQLRNALVYQKRDLLLSDPESPVLQSVNAQLRILGQGNKSMMAQHISDLIRDHLKSIKMDEVKSLIDKKVVEGQKQEDDESQATVTKEEGESTSREASWDAELGEQSVFSQASPQLKFLLGTIPKESTDDLVIDTVWDIKDIQPVLQEKLVGTFTMEQILAKVEGLAMNPDFQQRHPWIIEVYDRLSSLEEKIDNTDDILPVLFRQGISADMRKVNNSPALPTVFEDGRVSVIDPAMLKTLEVIKGEWDQALKNKLGKVDFLELREGQIRFKKDGKILKDGSLLDYESVKKNLMTANIDELIEYAEIIGIEFSDPELLKESAYSGEVFEDQTVKNLLRSSLSAVYLNNVFQGGSAEMFSRRYSGQVGVLNQLARLEFQYSARAVEASYFDANNKMRHSVQNPTYISLQAMRGWSDRRDLHPEHTSYAMNSLLAQQLEENGGEPLDIRVQELMGLRSEENKEEGDRVAKLTPGDITVSHIAVVMKGMTVLPRAADKGTEIGASLDFWENAGLNKKLTLNPDAEISQKLMDIFKGYIEDDIAQSIRYAYLGNHLDFRNKNGKSTMEQLRLMRGLLTEDNGAPGEALKIIEDYLKKQVEMGMRSSKEDWAGDSKNSAMREGIREVLASNRDLIEAALRKGIQRDMARLNDHLQEHRLVEFVGNNQVDLIGISPEHVHQRSDTRAFMADYNDFLADFSIRHFIGKQEMFKFMLGDPALHPDMFKRIGGAPSAKITVDTSQVLFNKVKKSSDLATDTPGRLRIVEIDELMGMVPQTFIDQLVELADQGMEESTVQAYEKPTKRADGTMFMLADSLRYISIGAAQWSPEKESVFQAMRGTGEMNSEVIEKGGAFAPEKFQYFGPFYDEVSTVDGSGGLVRPGMLKMSVVPMHEYMGSFHGKTYVNYMAMLDFMRTNKIDSIVVPSAEKWGNVKKGLKTGVKENAMGARSFELTPESVFEIDLGYFGVQQKISQKFKGKVLNTVQAQAHLTSDMYEDGMVLPEFEGQVQLAEEFNDLRAELVSRGLEEVLNDFNIKEVNGIYTMEKDSYDKLLEFLEKEGQSKDLSSLLMAGIEAARNLPDTGQFRMEMLVDPSGMERALMSVLGKKVIRQKRNGEMLIQVSDANYTVVMDENGDVSSDELGFYEESGKWVMEVLAPNHLSGHIGKDLRVTEDGVFDGDVMITDRTALDGIGIRIPTDGIHSIEIIRIKDFLPPMAGPQVVVPHQLLIKAGSDFDIDKLTIYFNSLKKRIDGVETAVKYHSTLEDWYQDAVDNADMDIEVLDSFIEGRRNEISNLMRSIFSETYEDQIRPDMTSEEAKELVKTAISNRKKLKGSFEEWYAANPDATIRTVQSKKAVENRMMEVMKELLSLSNRAKSFMKPVNATTIQDVSKELKAIDAEFGTIGLVDINNTEDLHLATSLPGIIRVTDAAFEGKATVGAYALGGTHHPKSQKASLMLKENIFYFDGMELGQPSSMGSITSLDGFLISDGNSQLINSAVDNANEPDLYVLNFGLDMAGTVQILLRNRVKDPIRTIAFFMNQPIIREYTKAMKINKAIFLRTRKKQVKKEDIVSGLIKKYGGVGPSTPIMFTTENLKDLLTTRIEERDADFNKAQVQILKNLQSYMEIGEDLTTAINVQSYDTKPPRSRADALVMERAYAQVINKGTFINLDEVVTGSYLRPMKEYVDSINKILDSAFFISGQPVYIQARELVLAHLLDPDNPAMRGPRIEKVKRLEKLEQSYLAAILQNVPDADGDVVGRHAERLMFGSQGKESMAQTLAQIQKGEGQYKGLKDNKWIGKVLAKVQGERNTPGLNDHLEMKKKGLDPLEMESLHEAFNEIRAAAPDLAKDLLFTAILQSGTIQSPFQLLGLIPGDYYLNWVKGVLDNMTSNGMSGYDVDRFLQHFLANNAFDNTLVSTAFKGKGKSLKPRELAKKEVRKLPQLTEDDFSKPSYDTRLFIRMGNAVTEMQDIKEYSSISYLNMTGQTSSLHSSIPKDPEKKITDCP